MVNLRRRALFGSKSPAYILNAVDNPVMTAYFHEVGLCASPDGMTAKEAAAITSLDSVATPYSKNVVTNKESADFMQYFVNLKTIPGYFFRGTHISSIKYPDSLLSIGMWCTGVCYIDKFVFPEGFLGVATYNCAYGFNGTKGTPITIIFKGTTPPRLNWYQWGGGDWRALFSNGAPATVYVPDASVSVYKTAWQNATGTPAGMTAERCLGCIRPISEYELPAGYTQVHWINSNGNTKIVLTDWGITRPFDVELYVGITQHTNSINYIFAGEQGSVGWCSNKKAHSSSGDGNSVFSLNGIFGIDAHFRTVDADCSYVVDGNDTGVAPVNDGQSANNIPTLFGRSGDNDYRCEFKLYSFRIFDTSGNMTHNCIPCIDSNNTPCLYDIINKRTAYFVNDNNNDASLATYG